MDLGLITKKVLDREYNNEQEFVDDMELVFNNCLLYNPKTSIVAYNGKSLQTYFRNHWSKIINNKKLMKNKKQINFVDFKRNPSAMNNNKLKEEEEQEEQDDDNSNEIGKSNSAANLSNMDDESNENSDSEESNEDSDSDAEEDDDDESDESEEEDEDEESDDEV